MTARIPVPPGPRLMPLVGLGIAMQRDVLGFLQDTARRWDGLVRLGTLGPTPAFLAVDPELAGQVLQSRWREFGRGDVLPAAAGPAFGEGLLLATGELHLRLRRTMQPAFTRTRLGSLAPLIVDEVNRCATRWDEHEQRTPSEPIPMGDEMARLTQQVFVRIMFDCDFGPELDRLLESWAVVNRYITQRLVSPFRIPGSWPTRANRRVRRAIEAINETLRPMIAERRAAVARGENRRDLLSLLLQARDPETGEGLDDAMLRDQVLVTFFAGFETTSTALTWVWILLAQHPEVQQRVYAELDAVVGDREPTLEDAMNLPYLGQVFDEVLRLYPSAFLLARQPIGEQELGGHRLSSRSVVFVSPHVLHRDARRWEDPERFDPDRFAEGREIPRFAYLPFGAGPRVCIGKHLARLEAMLILAALARRFMPKVVEGHEYQSEALFTLRHLGGAPMLLGARG